VDLHLKRHVRQSDPDTMYLWQAMRQADWAQFKQVMQEEINAHTTNEHWKLIKRSSVPKEGPPFYQPYGP
jgi:hypothetical protein